MEINKNMAERNSDQWLYFSWIPKIGKFVRYRLVESKKLIGAVKYFGFYSPLIKFWIINLSVYSFIYPITRIILGQEKSSKICSYFVKMPAPPGVFSFPILTKNKIVLRENTDWGILIEIYMSDVYYKDALRQGMNVIDIGAHIGLYTILAAEKIGNMGKVIAVEPESQNYKRLLENVKINNFKNVTPIKIALSDHNGLEKLYISPSSVRHSLLPQERKDISTEITVKTLDKLLAELNIKKIDIIKIDAEGAEMAILKGAKKTLENNPNAKITVASYHYPSEVKEVQSFLYKMGFKTKISLSNIVITT